MRESSWTELAAWWLRQYPAKAKRRAELVQQEKQSEHAVPGRCRRIRELEAWLSLADRALNTLPEDEAEVLRACYLGGDGEPGAIALQQKLHMDRNTVGRKRADGLEKLSEALFGK